MKQSEENEKVEIERRRKVENDIGKLIRENENLKKEKEMIK